MYIDPLVEIYQTLDLSPTQGCTSGEIAQAERLRGLAFPAAYREFLAWAGVDSGDIFTDLEDSHYLRMIEFLDQARSLAAQPHFQESLPADAIIVAEYDSVQYSFIRAGECADPPVYAFVYPVLSPAAAPEGSDEFIKGPPFTAWLAGYIESLED
jgi:hypothetical protein